MTNLKTQNTGKPEAKAPKTSLATLATAVKMLPVADMRVSKLNMRAGQKAPDIDDIYPSILESGINQSLLVRKEGKKWGVIAGRRRLFALKKKAKETGKAVTAPCIIMQSGQVKAARQASLLENVARIPATQREQFAAFKALCEAGQTPTDIAASFNITEIQVKRVLALAALLPEILDLYDLENISWGNLQSLTLATPDQQADWLKLYHSDDYAPSGDYLKEWLFGGAKIKTENALFELSEYDGSIVTNLFGDEDYFADPDMFWTYQNKAVAAMVDDWKAEGWAEIVVLDRGHRLDTYEFGKFDREQGGKIYVATFHDGSVKSYIGYLPKSDIKKINNILGLETEGQAPRKNTKPEMSGPMKDYVALHRHSAVRATMLAHPKVALRLSVAHMLVGSFLWTVAPQATHTRNEATTASVASSKGAAKFEAERDAIYALMGISQFREKYTPTKKLAQGDLTEIFARLLELDDGEVLRVMTFAMCESIDASSRIVEALTYAIPVDMAELWEPDEAFFTLLRDKAMINAMVCLTSALMRQI